MGLIGYPRNAGGRNCIKPLLNSELNPSHPLASGLIALYLMNEGGGAPIERVGNQGQATLSGPTWVYDQGGPGLKFNSGADLFSDTSVTSALPLSSSQDFTVEVLVQLTATPSTAHIFGIVNDPTSGTTGGSRSLLCFTNSPTDIYFWGNGRDLDSGVAWRTDGSLQHVFVTRAGSTMTFYRDGVQIASGSTPSLATSDSAIWAGSKISGNTFTGILHKGALYKRALSAAEVSQLTASPWAYMTYSTLSRRLLGVPAPGRLIQPIIARVGNDAFDQGFVDFRQPLAKSSVAPAPRAASKWYFWYSETYSPTITQRGTWTNSAINFARLRPNKTSGGAVTTSPALSKTVTGNYISGTWVSDPLPAQTIYGVLDGIIAAANTNTGGSTANLRLHLYVQVGTSDVVRGTLLSNYTDAGVIASGAAVGIQLATQTLTSVAVQDGDTLVLEYGWAATITSGTTTVRPARGTTDSTGKIQDSDATVGGSVLSEASWIQITPGVALYDRQPARPVAGADQTRFAEELPYQGRLQTILRPQVQIPPPPPPPQPGIMIRGFDQNPYEGAAQSKGGRFTLPPWRPAAVIRGFDQQPYPGWVFNCPWVGRYKIPAAVLRSAMWHGGFSHQGFPMIEIIPGSTQNKVYFLFRDNQTGLPKTSLTTSSSGAKSGYMRNGGSPTAITLVQLSTVLDSWTSGGFIECSASVQPGEYMLMVPDASCATGASLVNFTLGFDGVFGEGVQALLRSQTSAVGAGAISWTITVNDSHSLPLEDAEVWVSSDSAGSNVVAGTLNTNAFGQVTFSLDAGTYYLWVVHVGYTGTNPTTFAVA